MSNGSDSETHDAPATDDDGPVPVLTAVVYLPDPDDGEGRTVITRVWEDTAGGVCPSCGPGGCASAPSSLASPGGVIAVVVCAVSVAGPFAAESAASLRLLLPS